MKMTYALLILMITTAFTIVLADNMPHSNMPGMHQDSSVMNMENLHNHIRNMEKIMEQVHQSNNNKDTWKLMEKHMQEMQEGVTMMGPMMNMMGGQQGHMSVEQMTQQLNMMDQRLDMLQQMMQHMVDQQSMFMQQRGMMK